MKIHLGTPFCRKHLLKTLIYYLKPMNIEWYPVCDYNDIEAFGNNKELWIHPILCDPFKPEEHAVRKCNNFLDSVEINDNDYYCFCGDDDMYEPGFFDIIRKQKAKIIMCSLVRGDTIPKESHPHPVYPLIIDSLEKIKTYNIGLPQYILKGEVAKQIRFNNKNNFDDGIFAEQLKNRWPDEIKFLPDLFVFGNYFEHGRYTNDKFKLKKEWELPTIL